MTKLTLLEFLISTQDVPQGAVLFVNPDDYDDYFVGDIDTDQHPRYVRTFWQWNRSCSVNNLKYEIIGFLKGRSDEKGKFEYLGKKYDYDGVFRRYESGQLPEELKTWLETEVRTILKILAEIHVEVFIEVSLPRYFEELPKKQRLARIEALKEYSFEHTSLDGISADSQASKIKFSIEVPQTN